MKAFNLFAFTRVEPDYAAEYMNMLAAREQKEKCRSHEFLTLRKLVEIFLDQEVPVQLLDGFFFSYTIRQIGKEFDLLKIEPDRTVLNIELKSEAVPPEEIEKQLRQNRYYLKFVAPDIRLFTFVGSTGTFYQLIGDTCYEVSCEALIDALPSFRSCLTADIEKLFEPKQFLISPFTDPSKFLKGKYFLTQQQQEIREKILEALEQEPDSRHLFGITGGTGSGKTLLLYDIARTAAGAERSCCMIHTGSLCDGHRYLNDHWDHVEIFSISKLRTEGTKQRTGTEKESSPVQEKNRLSSFDCIFVDEAHRMFRSDLELLLEQAGSGAALVFSYDNEQWLSHPERQQDIPACLAELEHFREWGLSRRIRTGIEIAAFYRNMLDLNNVPRGEMDYSHIDVLYARNEEEAELLTGFYRDFLHYNCPNEKNSCPIAGQEYENVLITVGPQFRYDREGCLTDGTGGDPEQDSRMYENITRTRGQLCILVTGSYRLFQQIAGIKYRMLERSLYRENLFPSGVSGKQLTRLTRALKTSAGLLPPADGTIVTDTVDLIQEQLTGSKGSRKLLQNSLHMLEHLSRDYRNLPEFVRAAEEYVLYLRSELGIQGADFSPDQKM